MNVVLDLNYQDALGIAGSRRLAIGKATDFPAACVGKTLAVGTSTYTIRDWEPQDDGAVVFLPLSG